MPGDSESGLSKATERAFGVGAREPQPTRPVLGLVPALLVLQTVLIAFIAAMPFLGRPAWEYRVESPSDAKLADKLKDVGAEGWELVAARRAAHPVSGESEYEMIFKRRTR